MVANSSYRDLSIRATPHAKKEYIRERAGKLEIAVKEKAEEGRANERVRALVAGHFFVPEKNVRIIKGARQPAKIVRIYGA